MKTIVLDTDRFDPKHLCHMSYLTAAATLGNCLAVGINSRLPSDYARLLRELKKHDQYHAPAQEWHQLTNPFDEPCHLVEIQHGSICDEADIVRLT